MPNFDKGPGNRSKVWSQAIVFRACAELEAKEEKPTVLSVRRHVAISTGSDSTVQKYIREYRNQQVETADQIDTSIPEPITSALSSLWETAKLLARKELESKLQQVNSDRASLQAERLDIESIMVKSEERVQELSDQIKALTIENGELTKTLDQQTGAIRQLATEKNELLSELNIKAAECRSMGRVIEEQQRRIEDQIAATNVAQQALGKAQLDSAAAQEKRIKLVKVGVMAIVKGSLDKEQLEELKDSEVWDS
ncbi:DNA-binding protein [uncultured Amphritea sp.]|uniref:DNA-binding protein n=1 Tax=uncultured Amphritea sp. TaxID=981605 RepID=UPI0026164DC5|nr:DNA-binding protein [uncultured Amphritea sp.]